MRTAARAARLYLERGFSPGEVLLSGLLDPARCGEERRLVSKREMVRIQQRLNPHESILNVEDKDRFYRRCEELGLAAPRLYAVLEPGRPGWTREGVSPRTRAEWVAHLDRALPEWFVVKPVAGVYGRGLTIYVRDEGGFRDHDGGRVDAGQLYDSLASNARFERWLIQERLVNHSDLVRLTGTRALMTLRLDTLAVEERVVLVDASLKVVTGDGVVDNFQGGTSGNLDVVIDTRRGILRDGLGVHQDGSGRRVETHPRTGLTIPGVEVPLWNEAVALAERAARSFLPLRTVGWDVAVTPEGPALVEGNAFWDPPPQLLGADALDELERAWRSA